MIELRVRKRLRPFELDVESAFPAGVTLLTGPSGSGKTTILRMIAGLVRPDAGRIALHERTLDDGRVHVAPSRREIGYVFQGYALFPHLDVLDNAAYGPRARGATRRAARAAGRAALERVGIAELAAVRPATLSGGEAQRVALARALAPEPRALLLDEPFAALDAATRDAVRDALRPLLEALGIPVVLVTHDPGDAAFFAAPVVRLERGRLAQV